MNLNTEILKQVSDRALLNSLEQQFADTYIPYIVLNNILTKSHNCGQSMAKSDFLRGTLIVVHNVIFYGTTFCIKKA